MENLRAQLEDALGESYTIEREIAVAAALQEPHIVPVITAGDLGGLPSRRTCTCSRWISLEGELAPYCRDDGRLD